MLSDFVFLLLLGSMSMAGIGLGFSWEPIATIAGAALGVYACVRQAIADRFVRIRLIVIESLARRIEKYTRTTAESDRGPRGRLSRLIRRVCQPSSREPPAGPRPR
jgi:hypothetical protein